MVVEYSYDEVGEYAGTLILRDVIGNQAVASFVVKVNDTEPPTISDPGIQNALFGESFSFPRGIADDNTGIVEFLWEFDHLGEEVRLLGEFQAYNFESSGEVVVSLTVWDSAGNEAQSQFTVRVTDPVRPVARAGPDIEVDMGVEVTLVEAGSSDNEAIASYLWSFTYDEELRTLEGQCATYTFDIPGTYEVVLTVLDPSGNNGTDSLSITVRDTLPPESSFTIASPVDVGTKVLLDGGGSVDNVGIVEYSWEFEYRSSSMVLHGSVAEFEFAFPGTYEIRLTVTDSAGLEDSATEELVVLRPSDGDGDRGWDPTVLIGIAVVLAVVAAMGLSVLVRVRRGKLE